MPKIDSLYQLIKKTKQKKGRSLKIICDWDDTIQSYQPMVLYELVKKVKENSINFENFFKCWATDIDGIKEKDKFYDQAPFIDVADDLLLAAKEDLVSELIFLSYFNKKRFPNGDERKEKKFQRTFGKLSQQVKVDMKLISSLNKPQWILENHSDFDIFIDDLPKTISESIKTFSDKNKIFVMPDEEINFGARCERIEGDNIYHLQVGVSSLKDENFETTQNATVYEYESKILYKNNYNGNV